MKRNNKIALLLALNTLLTTAGCAVKETKDPVDNQPVYRVVDQNGKEVELPEEQMRELQELIQPKEETTYKVVDQNGNEIELTEEQMAAITGIVKENEPLTYNYGENVATVNDTNYVALTTEKFEELVTASIRKLEAMGLQVSREDVIKFITVFNIDKLKQDNPELVRSIIGTQTIEEVFADGEKVSDTLLNREAEIMFANDNPEWSAYVNGGLRGLYVPNTDLIPSVADYVFDETQQELIRSFEARRNEILKVNDVAKRSEMVKQLLIDILRSDSEYRRFDDASLELVLRHCIVTLDGFYCRDFLQNRTALSDDAYNMVVEFIAPVGSTEEQIMNSVMSGARRNMMDSFKLCQENTNTKTR